MPFLDLTIEPSAPSRDTLDALGRGLAALMGSHMRKRVDLTAIRITTVPGAHLSIGGDAVPTGRWSGRLLAYVTAGTNTEEEKARFIAAAHELLSQHLQAPASPFYIVVHEVPAGAWGYDGRTQAERARAVQAVEAG